MVYKVAFVTLRLGKRRAILVLRPASFYNVLLQNKVKSDINKIDDGLNNGLLEAQLITFGLNFQQALTCM